MTAPINRPKIDYKYSPAQCDVLPENRQNLQSFREKRNQWLAWLKTDQHHPISIEISSLAWNDVALRTLMHAAELDRASAVHNQLIFQSLIYGYFAVQVLIIRRMMDTTKNVISLVRLLDDIEKNIRLFTRENFVAFDGLPYDYEAAKRRVMEAHLGKGPFWGAKSGPDAHSPSEMAHQLFDRLAKIDPSKRSRTDELPRALIGTLRSCLTDCDASEIAKWSHNFLAHATADGAASEKLELAKAAPTLDKITNVLRCFVRVTEVISAYLLFDTGHGTVVPVAQFNKFEYLCSMEKHVEELDAYWDKLAKERDRFLEEGFDWSDSGMCV